MILSRHTAIERIRDKFLDDADSLETLALKFRRIARECADIYKTDECQDLLNAIEDLASDALAEAKRIEERSGQDALDTVREVMGEQDD